MSTTSIQSSVSVSRMEHPAPFASHPQSTHHSGSRGSDIPELHSPASRAPYIDLEIGPYPCTTAVTSAENATSENPVADLIPDEVYQLLRSNDLINAKGVRDYLIRRAFRAMREQQDIKSSEALERLQAIYPYLQIDTIRKIIYRIGPGANRKMML